MAGLFDTEIEDINERNTRSFQPLCGVSCTLCDHCYSSHLQKLAKNQHGYMFVAGSPTNTQDKCGNVWTGSYKSIILPLIEKYKVNKDDISFVFATSCHGESLSELTDKVLQERMLACRPNLLAAIEKANPDVIIPMDMYAWEALTQDHLTGRIEKASYKEDFIFNLIPDQTLGRYLAPIISPQVLTAAMKDRKRQDEYVFYNRKLVKFLKMVFKTDTSYKKFPHYAELFTKDIRTITDLPTAISVLKHILLVNPKHLSFDFETEGLKLERQDMNIVCVGLAYSDHAYSMPFFYDSQEFLDAFRELMVCPTIGKIAHHAKYESRCCLTKLGVCPEPWAWDSMYGAHVLNNKVRCGLKPQTYINFGIAGYDSIEPLFESESLEEEDKRGNNRRNKLLKAFNSSETVRDKALFYVAQDAMYTLVLAEKQMAEVKKDEHVRQGEEMMRTFINSLVKAEVNGMVIDKAKVLDNMEECDRIIEEMEKLINEEAATLWDPDIEGHDFDYKKSTDLAHYIYDLAKMPKEYTEKGKLALDSDTLDHMPLTITDNILEARRIAKIRDTYLLNLKREAVLDPKDNDYKLHSVFQLHVTDTFRSSSSGGVNLQNIPSHDKRALSLIKSCIVPPKGMYILGGDYSALEITVGCSLHHDKNMTEFLISGGDMHRATTKDIYFLTDEQVDAMDKGKWKELRQVGKRGNFLLMYGGGAKLLASIVWKDAQRSPERMKYFTDHGITTYDEFFPHIQDVYNGFWNVQFPEYGAWSRGVYDFYRQHGYVELPAGFKCYGPMSSMQATNAPVQGSAAQLALYAGANITRELEEKHMKSHIIDYIHDAIYICTCDEELDEVLKLMKKWMIDEAYKKFPWISTPLVVDTEKSMYREDGGNWGQEEEVCRLK